MDDRDIQAYVAEHVGQLSNVGYWSRTDAYDPSKIDIFPKDTPVYWLGPEREPTIADTVCYKWADGYHCVPRYLEDVNADYNILKIIRNTWSESMLEIFISEIVNTWDLRTAPRNIPVGLGYEIGDYTRTAYKVLKQLESPQKELFDESI